MDSFESKITNNNLQTLIKIFKFVKNNFYIKHNSF